MIKISKGELLEWGVCKVGEEDSQGRWVAEDNLVVLTEEEYNRMVGSPVDGMTFGQAIEAMKQGKKVTRLGWNGNRKPIIIPPYEPHDFSGRIDVYHGLVYLKTKKGKIAVCDECDYERVSKYHWTLAGDGRHVFMTQTVRGKSKNTSLHHFILGKPPQGYVVDHINGDGLDCRRCNMRFVTSRENNLNRKSLGNSSSRYKGVTFDKSRGKWNASIYVKGRSINLGRYNQEEDAARAYDKAAYQFFGEYARLNFPQSIEWRSPRMFLWLKEGTRIKSDWCHDPALKAVADNHGGEIEALGTICMKTADDKILTGWLASQTDMLSTDWTIAG